ncbi:hypothetical protein [Burkholderia pyrrocinia]|uniref:hypothetical protein n=1 Tax=Burkholderia pyrrocinia TaxID=60550 RepID=UPI00158C4124|nr:hypothetical protein [Burkholderia pyrrocinia]
MQRRHEREQITGEAVVGYAEPLFSRLPRSSRVAPQSIRWHRPVSQRITRGFPYVDNYRLTLPAIVQTYWQARFPAIGIFVTVSKQAVVKR